MILSCESSARKTCLIWFHEEAAIEILVAHILCDVLRLDLYVAGNQEQTIVGDNENEDLL